MDLRYEWAVKSDPLPNTPESSPASDALYYLGEDGLAGNASVQPPASLAYYMAALEENARNATSQANFAGAGHVLTCTNPSPMLCAKVLIYTLTLHAHQSVHLQDITLTATDMHMTTATKTFWVHCHPCSSSEHG